MVASTKEQITELSKRADLLDLQRQVCAKTHYGVISTLCQGCVEASRELLDLIKEMNTLITDRKNES